MPKVGKRAGAGKPPAEWQLMSWNAETVQEVTAADWKGAKAFGFRTAAGEATTILFGPEVTFAGPRVRARVEYAIPGKAGVSHVRFKASQPTQLDARDLDKLPATGGAWQTADFALDRQDSTAGHLELHTSGLPVGETVWVKSVTVYESAE